VARPPPVPTPFTRQFVISGYIVDFACRSARLVVELDGGQHGDNGSDEGRTGSLEALGWKVVRFWNNEVLENRDAVAKIILELATQRLPGSSADASGTTFREPRSRTCGDP
jgi:very-short-patch-repair endonuclease